MTQFKTLFGSIFVAVLLTACGDDKPTSGISPPATAGAKAGLQTPEPTVASTVAPKPQTFVNKIPPTQTPIPVEPEPRSDPPKVMYFPAPYDGNATLQERIVTADVIAHVRMISVAPNVARFQPDASTGGTIAGQYYAGVLKFTFAVQEYLKSGTKRPNRITAIVGSLDEFDAHTEAQTVADKMLAERDTQWDDRDAIVFLVNESGQIPSTASENLYFMSVWTSHSALATCTQSTARGTGSGCQAPLCPLHRNRRASVHARSSHGDRTVNFCKATGNHHEAKLHLADLFHAAFYWTLRAQGPDRDH